MRNGSFLCFSLKFTSLSSHHHSSYLHFVCEKVMSFDLKGYKSNVARETSPVCFYRGQHPLFRRILLSLVVVVCAPIYAKPCLLVVLKKRSSGGDAATTTAPLLCCCMYGESFFQVYVHLKWGACMAKPNAFVLECL